MLEQSNYSLDQTLVLIIYLELKRDRSFLELAQDDCVIIRTWTGNRLCGAVTISFRTGY